MAEADYRKNLYGRLGTKKTLDDLISRPKTCKAQSKQSKKEEVIKA